MPSIVTLQNGDSIATGEDAQALVDRFNASRRDGTLIRVEAGDDPVWVNPHVLVTIRPQSTPPRP